MKTIAFFNNKGGVGKTSLVYHLACMYAELGVPVLAADLDPQANLSSINQAVLVAAQDVVVPLAPDLHSLQGLKNLGPTLGRWRDEWAERRQRNPLPSPSLPPGTITPVGYVVLQHAVRLDRPVMAYDRWMSRIPGVYHRAVLREDEQDAPSSVAQDGACLAALKHYRSLMPLAQEARKPMFFLRAADGAIGGHAQAVLECYHDFERLARRIAKRSGVHTP